MAICVSNHPIWAPLPGLSSSASSLSSRTPKTLKSKTSVALQFLHLGKSITNSPAVVHILSSVNRPFFKTFLAPPDSAPPTINDKEGNLQNDVKSSEGGPGLKNLIRIYREAILYGDQKTVSEIEAKISIIERENSELVQKVSALAEELTSGKEKYIRLQADFDNFRKRSEKDRLSTRSDAQGEVIESLLPMVDSFERAKQQIKPETEKEKKIDTSYQGIYKQLVEIMRSLQVAAVPTVGKPFDPSMHEAIAREDSLEFKEGIVIQEFRRGFLLGDRLLRPAMVKVSAGPGSKKSPVASEIHGGQPATAAGVDER